MDNILKYILGVLGVAALIALAIPENAGKPKDDPSTLKPIAPAPIASTNGPIPPATTDEADSGDDAMEDWVLWPTDERRTASRFGRQFVEQRKRRQPR
jgi:hypothetical protein